jgi:tRNA(Ile)-lysidine synthetase-like protein
VVERVLRSFAEGSAEDWPVELRADALRMAARRQGVRLRGHAARRAAARMSTLRSGQVLDLGGGLRLERAFDTWSVRPADDARPADVSLVIPSPAGGSGRIVLGGYDRVVRWGCETSSAMAGTRVALYVPGEHYPLTVRGRRPGDRIRLPGGTRRLSRVLGADRVEARHRDRVPVVADCRGNVLCAVLEAPRIAREALPGADDANNANIVIEVEDG